MGFKKFDFLTLLFQDGNEGMFYFHVHFFSCFVLLSVSLAGTKSDHCFVLFSFVAYLKKTKTKQQKQNCSNTVRNKSRMDFFWFPFGIKSLSLAVFLF